MLVWGAAYHFLAYTFRENENELLLEMNPGRIAILHNHCDSDLRKIGTRRYTPRTGKLSSGGDDMLVWGAAYHFLALTIHSGRQK